MSASDESVSSNSNSEKVKVFKPKAIVIGFHGTIAPIDWEDSCLLPYIRQHLKEYLTQNWNNTSISQLIPKLRQESCDQHFVYEISECPVIGDEDDEDLNEQILSVNDFLIWQMDYRKEIKESQKIFRLVWLNGLDNQQIKVPLFQDVEPALRMFKDKYKLRIALISSIEESICRKLFANTIAGDIRQYFDLYFDKTTGNSKDKETFKKMAKALNVETKDIVYVTDFGQSAKTAHELGFQCLLIIRPMNRKIRNYYLLRFNQIHSLLDIQFIQRT